MRSYTCGLENFLALGHDFVHRHNVRIGVKLPEMSHHIFIRSTLDSHHVRLVDHIARCWNALYKEAKEKQTVKPGEVYSELPELRDVQSGKRFGLIFSHSTASFGGRLNIKQEEEPLKFELPAEQPVEIHQGLTRDRLIRDLNIDPLLLELPEGSSANELSGTSKLEIPPLDAIPQPGLQPLLTTNVPHVEVPIPRDDQGNVDSVAVSVTPNRTSKHQPEVIVSFFPSYLGSQYSILTHLILQDLTSGLKISDKVPSCPTTRKRTFEGRASDLPQLLPQSGKRRKSNEASSEIEEFTSEW